MTEASYLWTTGSSGDGTSTYTQTDTSNFMKVVAACFAFEGVAPGLLNALAVTGASSPVAVNTGGAIVDGKPYYNSASVNVTVATPSTLTRIDRIVLRASWAAHTVRITRIAGTEGGAAPAITLTSGTTYDILLYQASITTGGVITLTDERTFAQPTFNRQGGSATDFSASGTNNYVQTSIRMQSGVVNTGGSSFITITFPVAFSNKPIVIASSLSSGQTIYATSISATQVQLLGTSSGINIAWLAIGPT